MDLHCTIPIYEVNFKNVKTKLSDGSIITGKVNIAAYTRLSDYLKKSHDNFVTITDVEDENAPNKTVIINRMHIIWADTWEEKVYGGNQ